METGEEGSLLLSLHTTKYRSHSLVFRKSVAMYQEQTPWKGTVYADSPGLEVYTIQMKTDVPSNLAINQRIYETDKTIKIISMNHQYLVWGTGFWFSFFLENTEGELLRCSALPRIYCNVISSRSSIQCLSLFPELSLSPLLSFSSMSS